ncbi:MAG: ABC transporter substrate-binding protein [Bdellovibrionales bacterium]|nr:ABC transporter substrate-binding protein [Bdellovibrionales bacterium]
MKFVVGTIITACLGLGILAVKNSESQKIVEQMKMPAYVKAIYSMPVSYDPIKMNDGASLIFSELVYEGLLRFTEDYGVQPAIAKSWSTSDDGKVLTFKLNPNAKFHNGEPITAHDVKVSLSRNVSPESLVYKFYDVIKGAKPYNQGKSKQVDGLQVIDDSTIEIHLRKPYPPILYVLAGATAKVLPAKELLANENFFAKPIGSGPFKIQYIEDSKIFLARFSKYYGNKPKVAEMVLTVMDQKEAMGQASLGLVHDLSSWPMSGQEKVFDHGQDIDSIVSDTWVIGMNTRKSPFDDLEVRKLFQQSIDTEKFRTKFYPDAKPAFGYIPPGFPGHKRAAKKHTLLDQAPPKDLIQIHVPQELAKSKEMTEFFEEQLKTNGWNVEVLLTKWGKMMKGYNEKSLQAFLVSMIVDYPDSEFLLNNFESTNTDNFSGIADNEIDQLIKESRKTQDRVKRQKIQKQLSKRVNELALTVNLFHSRAHYWVHDCVEDFRPNLLAVAYTDYRKVKFNQECLERSGQWDNMQAMK